MSLQMALKNLIQAKVRQSPDWMHQQTKELPTLLGFHNYDGHFIYQLGDLATPLYILLYKDQPW